MSEHLLDHAPPGSKRSDHWPAVRAEHLKEHPVCAACGGDEMLQVHHRRPFHLHPTLELDPKNLITLCEKAGLDCHFVFGHAGHWHGYNPHVDDDAAAHLLRVIASVKLAKLSPSTA